MELKLNDPNFDYESLLKDFSPEDIMTARNIAVEAAYKNPPTYHCRDFEPHTWVLRAICEALTEKVADE